jgi:hypothetical protein
VDAVKLRLILADRTVQRARLCPASLDDVPALRFSVEDALRTIDFGDCGRLVLVRQLVLRGLPTRPTPAEVSRRLEAAWRQISSRACPAEHPQAEQSPAVFFASRAGARVQWLHRMARGLPCTAWFWPQALPELRAVVNETQAPERVVGQLLLEAPAALFEALRTWPDELLLHWAATLPVSLHTALNDALIEGPASLAPATAPVPGQAGQGVEAPGSEPLLLGASPLIRRAQRALGIHSPNAPAPAAWVLAVWGGTEGPARLPRPVVQRVWHAVCASAPPVEAAHAPVHNEGSLRNARLLTEAASPAAPFSPHATAPGAQRASPSKERSQPMPTTAAPATAPLAVPQVESGLRPGPAAHGLPHTWALPWLANAQPTAHGGLMCLVNAWQALGLVPWLNAQPRDVRGLWVKQLFTQALRTVGAAPADPQHAWFALGEEQRHLLHAIACVPAPPLVAHSGHTMVTDATRHWLALLRRALRRRAGLSLRELVQRPAWVSESATHIDVVMALHTVDLRLRRVGLDADPGWQPWFGRIVAFHFVDQDRLPPWPETAHG